MYLVMQIKHYTAFSLPNKLLIKNFNLLLLSNYKNSHYVWIKDFNEFITNKTKHHGKKYFWQYCFQCFSSSRVLESHVRNCLVITHTKSVLIPEENEWVNFWNFERLTKAPLIIYGNF